MSPGGSQPGPRGSRREGVVVTGRGVVSPLGWTADDFGDGVLRGVRRVRKVGVVPPGRLRVSLVAEVEELPPCPDGLRGFGNRMSRCDRFAAYAAEAAWRDAGLDPRRAPDPRLAVLMGVGAGGILASEYTFEDSIRARRAPRGIRSLASQTLSATTAWVAFLLDAAGPRRTYATACSSSLHAVARGVRLLRNGDVDRVVVGGSEAICKVTLAGFNALRAIDPHFSRPFHRDRSGLALGEGACVFVLEREGDARRRGARLWARILGSGASCDAVHITQPDADGRGASHAMSRALEDSARLASEVVLVEAHGTATPHNDVSESRAIARVLMPGGTASALSAVTAVKGNAGHTLGAAGAFGLLSVLESLRRGMAPPVAGTPRTELDPDCAPLPYVLDEARPLPHDAVAMINSFAFGGNNACVVVEGTEG